MGKLIKNVSAIGMLAQVLWVTFVFSTFDTAHLIDEFGWIAKGGLAMLALAAIAGWLSLTYYLRIVEIDNKTVWGFALLFLPAQFLFWLTYIHDDEDFKKLDHDCFDREAFQKKYDLLPLEQEDKKAFFEESLIHNPDRSRSLTPPTFLSLSPMPKTKVGIDSGAKTSLDKRR